MQHLGQLGIKRMMNHKLSLGWSAWIEMYENCVRQRNMLKAAASRLTKPKLVAGFKHWQQDWTATMAAAEALAAEEAAAAVVVAKPSPRRHCHSLPL